MRAEYDFSDSVPNWFAAQMKRQEHLISLEPDVYKVFNTSVQVNTVLKAIISAYTKKKRVKSA
ncbi:MAG: hypothetical protein A2X61_14700 [Ignavibacteria bacterium GWB2_35_12]|nr:MAG: hypothetical protein A2X63_06625 [Ignavibacteria bacterium GWA2_35_8]OGU38332.1 MAG: hypothetical protein A2X61_14700 [Ignavibacteria bacterium GWB2_35_12]OGU90701.1 MAG: hypothetical protein A2220_08730 [Ignavibacteria bacterium RIFOXYA2_FULL_35_10]OGV23433.1 MAG: hypothetical protein A2475_06555 [Ignavibacteria bacterium RIFOXYC2_FULL_35_21]